MTFWRLIQGSVFALLTLLLLAFCWRVEATKLLPSSAPDSLFGLPIGDFSNLWSAGILARHDALGTLYDANTFRAWKAATFGHAVAQSPWIYPPVALPLGAAFSILSQGAAFVCWNLGTLCAMAWLLRQAGLSWAVVALGVFCPAEWLSLIYGQYGGIISCLLFAALTLSACRPVTAGIVLGLAALKPQTALLVPMAWMAKWRWRALLAAVLTAVLLAVLPIALFGWSSWGLFFTQATPVAKALVNAPFGQGYQLTGTSVFWMLRSFGTSCAVAGAAQIFTAVLAVAATFWLWRRPGDPLIQASLTMLLALFVAPYGFSADMVGYGVALAVLAQKRGWRVSLLDGLFWLWPGYAALVTQVTGVLLTPLVVALAVLRAWPAVRP